VGKAVILGIKKAKFYGDCKTVLKIAKKFTKKKFTLKTKTMYEEKQKNAL